MALTKKTYIKLIYLTLVFLFFFFSIPRLTHLDAHWNSDESRWLRRSTQFMSAVKEGEFSKTLIAYHPGVTTMWLAGLRSFFTDPRVDVENLALARWFIGVLVWVGIGIASLLLYQLFGQWIALASFACLAYSPFFLAQTRRVHTDALASIFILLTILLLLIYCQNRSLRRYLVYSGIALGLALLSKSYALILLICVPLCLFFFGAAWKSLSQWHRFLMHIRELIAYLNCTLLTVFAFWPVFWTPVFGLMALCLFVFTFVLLKEDLENKHRTLMWLATLGIGQMFVCVRRAVQTVWLVFEKVDWAVTTPHEVEHFFLGKVVNDPGWLFYIFVLTIKSTPLLLPFAVVGMVLLWKHREHSDADAGKYQASLFLFAGVIIFTLCLSATSKKFSRYLLPAVLLLDVLASIGIVESLRWIGASLNVYRGGHPQEVKIVLASVAGLGFFLIQILPVLSLHPYYGTYYNPCWKVTDITKIITVGEASGLDIAANYLNEKPNPEALVVQVSPLAAEFVKNYFRGDAYRADKEAGRSPDYEVVYIRDSQIGRVPQTGARNGELEAVITLNGRDHVWIYRVPEEVH